MSDFPVAPTAGFTRDIGRLQDFLIARELASEFPDDTVLERFTVAVERGMSILAFAPHTCRRCEASPAWRELLIPFGKTGFVVLFEILSDRVLLMAARAQREEDYRGP